MSVVVVDLSGILTLVVSLIECSSDTTTTTTTSSPCPQACFCNTLSHIDLVHRRDIVARASPRNHFVVDWDVKPRSVSESVTAVIPRRRQSRIITAVERDLRSVVCLCLCRVSPRRVRPSVCLSQRPLRPVIPYGSRPAGKGVEWDVEPRCPRSVRRSAGRSALSHIVYCSRRGLATIPTGVAADTVQLNLNGNAFRSSTLERRNFSALTKLEHLYMSECGVEQIVVDAFADLASLRWLDLSNNHIKVTTPPLSHYLSLLEY